MRRILSPGFSAGAMQEQEPLIKGYVDLMIQRLHEKADNGKATLDVNFWYNCCTFDIIGDLSFGEPFGSLRESAMYPWFALVFANIKTTSLIIPFNRLPILRPILPLLAPKKFRQQAMDHKRASREKVSKRLELTNSRADFIQSMASGKNGQVGQPFLEVVTNQLANCARLSLERSSKATPRCSQWPAPRLQPLLLLVRRTGSRRIPQ